MRSPPPRHTPTGAFTPKWITKRWPAQNNSLLAVVLQTIQKDKTIIDVGAGGGTMVAKLRESGRDCYGVDGIDGVYSLTGGLVCQQELTIPVAWDIDLDGYSGPAEWAICFEVGEHIPPSHEQQFLTNLCSAATEGMMVTWATRAQSGGVGHCNCLDSWEVAERLAGFGWLVDDVLTQAAVKRVRRPFRKKLMVLTRG